MGQARIGAPAATAIASVTRSLGKPTRDLANPGQACQGPDRIVTWGRLTLTFSGSVLKGWVYELSPAGPPALTTAAGVTTGTTVAKLKEVYGARLTVYPPEPSFDASFEVDGGRALRGFLTAEAATGKVTSMGVGLGCAE